jgi:hypothetical protein
LESHYHQDQKITLSKFEMSDFNSKFEKITTVMSNGEKILSEAKKLKQIVDGLKISVIEIFTDLKAFSQDCESIKQNNQDKLNYAYISKV